MKKLLIISDIHGSSKYLKMALKREKDYEKILILGDLYYHGPRNNLPEEYNPKECASILNSLKEKIIVVRGNSENILYMLIMVIIMVQIIFLQEIMIFIFMVIIIK